MSMGIVFATREYDSKDALSSSKDAMNASTGRSSMLAKMTGAWSSTHAKNLTSLGKRPMKLPTAMGLPDRSLKGRTIDGATAPAKSKEMGEGGHRWLKLLLGLCGPSPNDIADVALAFCS